MEKPTISNPAAKPASSSGKPNIPAHRDWRVWFGLCITLLCLWFAAKGVSFAELAAAVAQTDLLLLLSLSIPGYLGVTLFQALRWRHLTNPIAPFPRTALYRSVAIGFMVNNLLPLRMGEFARSWHLARETNSSSAAILGTVVLERVLDVTCVVLLAAAALSLIGANSPEGHLLKQGALFILPIGLAPLVCLIIIRFLPEQSIAFASVLVRFLPNAIGDKIEQLIRQFVRGLGAISGGSHLLWIVLHSIAIWAVCGAIPMISTILAFDLNLGSPQQLLVTGWVLLAVLGVAVALPSAPGFLGVYQIAFKEVLERFGVESSTALAMALVAWLVFWITLTVQGLIIMRFAKTTLNEVAHQ